MIVRTCIALLACGAFWNSAFAQTLGYNFDAVTQLARGAVVGEHVDVPLPGFELLLMREGEVVYNQAFGQWTRGRRVDTDSATKPLSAAVVMSLVDSSPRPFSLDTKLSDYIPAFTGDKQSVTVRQAFSHMSGFGESDALARRDISLYEAALQIAETPSYVPPDFAFIYGGSAMHAAGAVAELAGRAPWRQLFDERIAEPLGLEHTQYVYSGPDNPRIGGGVRTTAGEYATFMEMLRNGGMHQDTQVLSPQAVDEMFTRQTPEGLLYVASPLNQSADHGVGIWLDQRDADGELTGALAGGLRGFTSWIDFDDGVVGVLATDLSSFHNVQDLQYLIRDAVEEAVRDPLPAGDANLNGRVGWDDGQILFANFGQTGKLWSEGDFNGDGVVDGADYVLWARNLQVAAGAAMVTIPEPTTWALLLSGLLLPLLAARRRTTLPRR